MDFPLRLDAEEQQLVLELIVRHRQEQRRPPALTVVGEPPAPSPSEAALPADKATEHVQEALDAAFAAIEREVDDPEARAAAAVELAAALDAAEIQACQVRGRAAEQLAHDQRIPLDQAARQLGMSRRFVDDLKAAREAEG